MATSLGYTPPSPPDTGATDELDDLLRALHESGLLRAMAGGARTYPHLLARVLRVLDADTIRSVLELAGAVGDLDPEQSRRLAAGLRQARTDAAQAASAKPEGFLRLLRRVRDPDTRRGLSAALAALAAVGGSLPREDAG